MTVTADEAMYRYGDPRTEKHMILWDVPDYLEVGVIPKRIYCNKDLVKPLEQALANVVNRGLADEIKTWDGCFNLRPSKGNAANWSLHAWGLAIDINAAWNRYGWRPTLKQPLIECFTDAGFEWGGGWRIADGMHFQIRVLP